MKIKNKILGLTILLLISFPGIPVMAWDNYGLLRLEYGERNDQFYHGTYSAFENRTLEDFAFNFNVATKNNQLISFTSSIYHRHIKNFNLGVRYRESSQGDNSFGPSMRWHSSVYGFPVIIISSYFFNLGNGADRLEVFGRLLSSKKENWYWGTEAWYIKSIGEQTTWKLRPIRVGYRAKHISPFAIGQIQFQDKRNIGKAILIGLEFNF